MKGDCQRFSVARQRRFQGVWDGFSRAFPQEQNLAANFANEHESELFGRIGALIDHFRQKPLAEQEISRQ
jgi:hypothetical protein